MLPDILIPGLRAVFCGTAVAKASAEAGHHYAGPGNEFWHLLYLAGLTTTLLSPQSDTALLESRLGLTDLVKLRAASKDSDLRPGDFDVDGLVRRIALNRPNWVAFNGKGAARVVARALGGGSVLLGPQRWRVAGVRVYVLPSTSGANRRPTYEGRPSRLAWFKAFASELEVFHPTGDSLIPARATQAQAACGLGIGNQEAPINND